MIKAITFDLWDTVIRDDSDEAKRAARGLPSKREARRAHSHALFERRTGVTKQAFDFVYDTMESAFNHVWHEQHVTWTVDERLEVLEAALRCPLPEPERAALVRTLEEMEVEVPPDPVEGIGDAIAELAAHFPLAVVSDAIYSPGRCLRRWLEMHGLLDYFGAFAFSDEVGHSKPHRSMFAHVAAELGVAVEEMLHIGDRGPQRHQGPAGARHESGAVHRLARPRPRCDVGRRGVRTGVGPGGHRAAFRGGGRLNDERTAIPAALDPVHEITTISRPTR